MKSELEKRILKLEKDCMQYRNYIYLISIEILSLDRLVPLHEDTLATLLKIIKGMEEIECNKSYQDE